MSFHSMPRMLTALGWQTAITVAAVGPTSVMAQSAGLPTLRYLTATRQLGPVGKPAHVSGA